MPELEVQRLLQGTQDVLHSTSHVVNTARLVMVDFSNVGGSQLVYRDQRPKLYLPDLSVKVRWRFHLAEAEDLVPSPTARMRAKRVTNALLARAPAFCVLLRVVYSLNGLYC